MHLAPDSWMSLAEALRLKLAVLAEIAGIGVAAGDRSRAEQFSRLSPKTLTIGIRTVAGPSR